MLGVVLLVKIRFMQGSPFIWFMVILSIFMIGFIFVILTRPVSMTYNLAYNDPALYDDTYQMFFRRAKTIWFGAPLIFIVCIIMWGIIKLHQQEGVA